MNVAILYQAALKASETNLYPKTTIPEWIRHLGYLMRKGHLEYVEDKGKLIGFGTWIRTPEPIRELAEQLPEDIDGGKYLQTIMAWVHPDYRNNGILKSMIREVEEKNLDATHWVWGRANQNNIIKVFKIRRQDNG